ncbi:tRNA (cytidine(34)-2'-O)-methyltransferase [Clostridiales bacterium]|nr:tRNA (cytidine(34)-2'-O)-methyltransferase [Clostridiales bacterium]
MHNCKEEIKKFTYNAIDKKHGECYNPSGVNTIGLDIRKLCISILFWWSRKFRRIRVISPAHLIEPLGFRIDDAKLKRAGLDYWHSLDIHYYKGLDDFFEKHPDADFYCFSTKAEKDYTQIQYPQETYLLFGKETRGLPEDFLRAHYDRCVRLPMRQGLRSLNLSNAVAIGVYEVLRQGNFAGLQCAGIIPGEQ